MRQGQALGQAGQVAIEAARLGGAAWEELLHLDRDALGCRIAAATWHGYALHIGVTRHYHARGVRASVRNRAGWEVHLAKTQAGNAGRTGSRGRIFSMAWWSLAMEADAAVDAEAAVLPGAHDPDGPAVDATCLPEQGEHLPAPDLRKDARRDVRSGSKRPAGSSAPSVTRAWTCGCQWARSPKVCSAATMPGLTSRRARHTAAWPISARTGLGYSGTTVR